MRHGILDESREGRRTIVLISPSLEAAFVPEDGMALCSLELRGEELLGAPIRLAAAPESWQLLAVERSDDDAHLEAEAGDHRFEARLASDELRMTSDGDWDLAALDPRVTVEASEGTLTLRVA